MGKKREGLTKKEQIKKYTPGAFPKAIKAGGCSVRHQQREEREKAQKKKKGNV